MTSAPGKHKAEGCSCNFFILSVKKKEGEKYTSPEKVHYPWQYSVTPQCSKGIKQPDRCKTVTMTENLCLLPVSESFTDPTKQRVVIPLPANHLQSAGEQALTHPSVHVQSRLQRVSLVLLLPFIGICPFLVQNTYFLFCNKTTHSFLYYNSSQQRTGNFRLQFLRSLLWHRWVKLLQGLKWINENQRVSVACMFSFCPLF